MIMNLSAGVQGWMLSPWEELGCAVGGEDPGNLSQLVPRSLDVQLVCFAFPATECLNQGVLQATFGRHGSCSRSKAVACV